MPTLAASQAVTDRVGPNANATIIASEAIIDRYIEIAEQTIVSETRRDWIDSYASLDSSIKATLELCTASHAAMEIIQYDMGGFSTRAEAITMLNVNSSNFQRTLKTLKDLDSVKIREVS